jgi:hypothetical protein
MPGSIITCQGLSSAYNSSFYAETSLTNYLTIDVATDTFNLNLAAVPSPFPFTWGGNIPFPFQTGDIVYYAVVNGQLTPMLKYFAIRVSSTTIKLAASYTNAINGVAIDITVTTAQISNTPFGISGNTRIQNNVPLVKDNWQSSSFSTASFPITQNIRFDFSLDFLPCFAGISTTSGSYAIGIGREAGITTVGRETTGGVFNFAQYAPQLDVRMTLQNRIITVARKETNGTHTNIYSTTALNIAEPLRFFAFLGINNTKIQNCIITYL